MDEPIPPFGDSLITSRLVAYSPYLYWSDTETASPHKLDTPAILTTRLTLVAQIKKNAIASEESVLIAKNLFSTLREGDALYMTRTNCCGIGLSAIRNGRLVLAVGAVSAVPLSDSIRARFPDMIQRGKIYFHDSNCDPELPKVPIEVTVGSETFTAYEGRTRLGEYELSVLHGFRLDFPGDEVCAAMIHTGAGSLEEAGVSARLLDCLER